MFSKLSATHDWNKTGCGLGLTICKQIVEKLGGTISLESEIGVGTIVRFKFPTEFSLNETFDVKETAWGHNSSLSLDYHISRFFK